MLLIGCLCRGSATQPRHLGEWQGMATYTRMLRLVAYGSEERRQRDSLSKTLLLGRQPRNTHARARTRPAGHGFNTQALIAKSITQIANTASQTVAFPAASPSRNSPTNSRVKPRTSRLADTIRDPTTIKGRRRPKRDVDLSATAPTNGWVMRPDIGPAIQTREELDFVRPSSRR